MPNRKSVSPDVLGAILAFLPQGRHARLVSAVWRSSFDAAVRRRQRRAPRFQASLMTHPPPEFFATLDNNAQAAVVTTLCTRWHVPPESVMVAVITSSATFLNRRPLDGAFRTLVRLESLTANGSWAAAVRTGPLAATPVRCLRAQATQVLDWLLQPPFSVASDPHALKALVGAAVRYGHRDALDTLAPYVTAEARAGLLADGGSVLARVSHVECHACVLDRLALPPYSVARRDLSTDVRARMLVECSLDAKAVRRLVAPPYCFGRDDYLATLVDDEVAAEPPLSCIETALVASSHEFPVVPCFLEEPFLARRADFEDRLPRMLYLACRGANVDMLDTLATPPFCCDHTTVRRNGYEALWVAVKAGSIRTLERLSHTPYNVGTHTLRAARNPTGTQCLLTFLVYTAIVQSGTDCHRLLDLVTHEPFTFTRDDYAAVVRELHPVNCDACRAGLGAECPARKAVADLGVWWALRK